MAKTQTRTTTTTEGGTRHRQKAKQFPIEVSRLIDKSDDEVRLDIEKTIEEFPFIETISPDIDIVSPDNDIVRPDIAGLKMLSDEDTGVAIEARAEKSGRKMRVRRRQEKSVDRDIDASGSLSVRADIETRDIDASGSLAGRTGYEVAAYVPTPTPGLTNRTWSEPSVPYERPALPSLYEHLSGQLGNLNLDDLQMQIAETIIGSLDDYGLLDGSVNLIAQTLNEELGYGTVDPTRDVEPVLKLIQQLDPVGIAARDLRECLILQLLPHQKDPKAELLLRILEQDYDGFLKIGTTPGQKKRLADKFGVSTDELELAIHAYRLTTRPAADYDTGGFENPNLIVDYTVEVDDNDQITIEALNSIPELRISSVITSKSTKAFREKYVKPAQNFIDVLRQRQEALMTIIEAVVLAQRDFFLSGDMAHIHPLTLKDIANQVGYHPSSISRVTSKRALATQYGNVRLKNMFTGDVDEGKTKHEIQERIRQIINQEDPEKPLSDQAITEQLKKEGYNIARRTVSKYRDECGIAGQKMRKR